MFSVENFIWGFPRSIDQAETSTIFFFSFKYVIDGHIKMIRTNFKIFEKSSLAVMVEIVDLVLKAVIDSFEI